MGKYSKVLDGLKRFFGEEPHRQQRIEAVKTRIAIEAEKATPESVDAMHKALGARQAELSELFDKVDKIGLFLLHPNRQGADYARAYRAVRILKEEVKERLSNINLLEDSLAQMMVEQFEVEDVDLLKLSSGDKVNVQFEPYPKTIDADAVRQWCIDQGYLSQMSLPWQTFHMMVKERLLEGLPAPPGIELTSRPKVVYTKSKENPQTIG